MHKRNWCCICWFLHYIFSHSRCRALFLFCVVVSFSLRVCTNPSAMQFLMFWLVREGRLINARVCVCVCKCVRLYTCFSQFILFFFYSVAILLSIAFRNVIPMLFRPCVVVGALSPVCWCAMCHYSRVWGPPIKREMTETGTSANDIPWWFTFIENTISNFLCLSGGGFCCCAVLSRRHKMNVLKIRTSLMAKLK